MSVATGTLEDENYQAAVTPSEAEGSKALRPPIVVRLGPLRTAVVMSVRIGVLATGPALFAATAPQISRLRSKRHFHTRAFSKCVSRDNMSCSSEAKHLFPAGY